MNGLKIDGGGFTTLPQEERDKMLFENVERLMAEMSEVKNLLSRRWKLNTVLTSIGSFFGGFSAWFIGSYFKIFPGGK